MDQEKFTLDTDIVNFSAYADSLYENLKIFNKYGNSQKPIAELENKFSTENQCYKEPLEKIDEVLKSKSGFLIEDESNTLNDTQKQEFIDNLKDLKAKLESEIINEQDKPKNINFLLKESLSNIDNLREESLNLLYKLNIRPPQKRY